MRLSPRQVANLAGAVAQVVAPLVAPRSIAEVTEGAPRTPARPVPATFAIWGPIFALCGAYAVRQARPGARDEELSRRVGWLTAAAFAGDALWEVVVPRRQLELGEALVVGTALSSTAAYLELGGAEGIAGADRWLVGLPIGMLAGWTTVASAVSTGDALARRGIRKEPAASSAGVALLALAGALAGHLARRGGGARRPHAAGYGGSVLWGLAGVAVNREAGATSRAGALVAALPVIAGLALRRAV